MARWMSPCVRAGAVNASRAKPLPADRADRCQLVQGVADNVPRGDWVRLPTPLKLFVARQRRRALIGGLTGLALVAVRLGDADAVTELAEVPNAADKRLGALRARRAGVVIAEIEAGRSAVSLWLTTSSAWATAADKQSVARVADSITFVLTAKPVAAEVGRALFVALAGLTDACARGAAVRV